MFSTEFDISLLLAAIGGAVVGVIFYEKEFTYGRAALRLLLGSLAGFYIGGAVCELIDEQGRICLGMAFVIASLGRQAVRQAQRKVTQYMEHDAQYKNDHDTDGK